MYDPTTLFKMRVARQVAQINSGGAFSVGVKWNDKQKCVVLRVTRNDGMPFNLASSRNAELVVRQALSNVAKVAPFQRAKDRTSLRTMCKPDA